MILPASASPQQMNLECSLRMAQLPRFSSVKAALGKPETLSNFVSLAVPRSNSISYKERKKALK